MRLHDPKVAASLRRTVDVAKDKQAALALAAAGYRKFAVMVDDGTRSDKYATFTFQVRIANAEDEHRHNLSDLYRNVVVLFNDEARKVAVEADRLRKAIGEAQKTLIGVKRQISDLPVAERRARAELAKVAIERDADGPALLAALRKAAAGRKALGA